MSFQFGFGWAKSDPNELCMREERSASVINNVRSSTSNPGAFVLQFSVDKSSVANLVDLHQYEMDGDYEQISTQMACRRLLLQCPGSVVFPRGGFPELSTNVTNNLLTVMKNKLGIRLKKKLPQPENEFTTPEDVLYHSIMFQAYHALLEQGYHAFATEDQLRGVVARKTALNILEVCSLRNCVVNHHEGVGRINVEVFQYKFTPAKVEDLSLGPSDEMWSRAVAPVRCVFLSTQEEVHLLAVATYRAPQPTSSSGTATYESSLLLTALDLANRARGFSLYLPESYEKARQYWELAYGFMLPRAPDGVMFGRIQTALGEQVVPLQVLVRGVVEVPWKDASAPLSCATQVYQCLQHRLPQVRALHPPQHPDDLARQLRAAYDHVSAPGEGEGEGTGPVVSSRPVKTLFISALRVKNAQIVNTPAHQVPSTTSNITHDGCDEDGGLFDEGDFFADTHKPPAQMTKSQTAPPPPPPLLKSPPTRKTQSAAAVVSSSASTKPVSSSAATAGRPPQGGPPTVILQQKAAAGSDGAQRTGLQSGGAVLASGDKSEEEDDDTASLSQDLSDSSQSSLLCTPPESSADAGAGGAGRAAPSPLTKAPVREMALPIKSTKSTTSAVSGKSSGTKVNTTPVAAAPIPTATKRKAPTSSPAPTPIQSVPPATTGPASAACGPAPHGQGKATKSTRVEAPSQSKEIGAKCGGVGKGRKGAKK